MAYAVNFIGSNLTLLAPPGREDVSDLHVFRNRNMVVSCWQLEPAEIKQIVKTGKVYLSILGPTMAPAYLGAEDDMRAFTFDYGPLPKQGRSPANLNNETASSSTSRTP